MNRKHIFSNKTASSKKPCWVLHLFCVSLCLLFANRSFSQDVISIDGQSCGLHGSAKYNSETWFLNGYKNRYTAPTTTDFDNRVTLSALAKSGDPNDFSQEKAAVIRGYVFDVKVGGVETCNCKTKDPEDRDTHIELTPSASKTGPEYRVIVEVTPRLRRMMKRQGVEWSTEGLRRSIKGKRVEVTGWLTYDTEHETGAYANDPSDQIGEQNWRATCWEVHPITSLQFVNGSDENNMTPERKKERPAEQRKGDQSSHNEETGHGSSTYFFVLALLAVVVIYFLARRKRR